MLALAVFQSKEKPAAEAVKSPEKKKDVEKGKLVEKEERTTGTVEWAYYMSYFKANLGARITSCATTTEARGRAARYGYGCS